MYGGIQAEIPQKANVDASDIRKVRIRRVRISGSAKRSTTVKRARASSWSLRAAPLRLRSVAAARCSFTRFHLSDSGIARLIHSVSSAGKTPSRNMMRQAPGPSGLMKSHANEARKKPMPKPHCISPTPLPRFLSGQSSDTIEVPVTHSEPMAQCDADRDDQRIGFVAIEDPAEVRRDQRVPLGTAK